MKAKNVAVVGGAGFVGIELVRYLLGHPAFNLVAVSSDSDKGKHLSELYPVLLGKTKLTFVGHAEVEANNDLDAVFLAVPHTASMGMVPKFLDKGTVVFDLSADFRLKDKDVYEQWYGSSHTATHLLDEAICGLPEINRAYLQKAHHKYLEKEQALNLSVAADLAQIKKDNSVLVACPGCYPTASILAIAPALAADYMTDAPVIINAISGIAGAGRAASQVTHFCSADENLNAYGATTHRHIPEISQLVAKEAGKALPIVFTPHLAPLKRGLVSTVTMQLKAGVNEQMLQELYTIAYEDEPFVTLLPFGQMPRTSSVIGSNSAQVGIAFDKRTSVLIASCVIDNLGKGAASQAVQCANIVFGYGEACGLDTIMGVV